MTSKDLSFSVFRDPRGSLLHVDLNDDNTVTMTVKDKGELPIDDKSMSVTVDLEQLDEIVGSLVEAMLLARTEKDFVPYLTIHVLLMVLAHECNLEATRHKFWDDDTLTADNPLHVASKLALIHTEVSEATEAYRAGDDMNHFTEEMADIIIRCVDLCEALGLDIGEAVVNKMIANRGRPVRHGGKKF